MKSAYFDIFRMKLVIFVKSKDFEIEIGVIKAKLVWFIRLVNSSVILWCLSMVKTKLDFHKSHLKSLTLIIYSSKVNIFEFS